MAHAKSILTRPDAVESPPQRDTIAHARIRALALGTGHSTSASLARRVVETVRRTRRWLAHNLRMALFSDQPGRNALVHDPAGVRALIRNARVALLTTRDRDGMLHSEPMEPSERDFDGVIWIPTSESAPVLERVRARGAVQLTYHDKHSNRCVVLDGIARICDGTGRRVMGRFIRVDVVSADAWD
jgi:hypothetical protein